MNRGNEHAFSIELKSRQHLRSIKLGNEMHDQVFIEGFLGELTNLKLVEGSMLEVTCVNGILRLDITQDEFALLLKAPGVS